VRGMSAAQAGLALTAATLTWTVGSWVQARRVRALGAGRLIRVGLGLVVGGVVLIAASTRSDVPLVVGLGAWGLAGLGMGLAYAPITLLVLHQAPAGREGAATAGLQLSDVLGTALGAGVGGVVLAAAPGFGWDERGALLLTFAIAAAAVVAGLGVTSRLGPASDPRGVG
jgi:MFS family permease